MNNQCDFPGCNNPKRRHGLCDSHSAQKRRGKELSSLQSSKPVPYSPVKRTEAQIAWMTGLFDGEGTISFTGTNSVTLALKMTDEDIVRQFQTWSGGGSVYCHDTRSKNPKWSDTYEWQSARKDLVSDLLIDMIPWFGSRRRERAENALKRLSLMMRKGRWDYE